MDHLYSYEFRQIYSYAEINLMFLDKKEGKN